MTVSVFLLCLAAGSAAGCLDGALSPARKRLNIAFTILSDIALAALSVFAHGAVMYALCDGIFFPYAAIAQAAGFFATDYAVRGIIRKIAVKFSKRKKTSPELQ